MTDTVKPEFDVVPMAKYDALLNRYRALQIVYIDTLPVGKLIGKDLRNFAGKVIPDLDSLMDLVQNDTSAIIHEEMRKKQY